MLSILKALTAGNYSSSREMMLACFNCLTSRESDIVSQCPRPGRTGSTAKLQGKRIVLKIFNEKGDPLIISLCDPEKILNIIRKFHVQQYPDPNEFRSLRILQKLVSPIPRDHLFELHELNIPSMVQFAPMSGGKIVLLIEDESSLAQASMEIPSVFNLEAVHENGRQLLKFRDGRPRSIGLETSRGREYVYFFNSDDYPVSGFAMRGSGSIERVSFCLSPISVTRPCQKWGSVNLSNPLYVRKFENDSGRVSEMLMRLNTPANS